MFEAEAEGGLREKGNNAEDEDRRFQRKHFFSFFTFFEVKLKLDFVSYQHV